MKKIIAKNKLPIFLVSIDILLILLLIISFKKTIDAASQYNALKRKTDELREAKEIVTSFNEDKLKQEGNKIKKIPVGENVPLDAMKEVLNIAQGAGIKDINIYQLQEGLSKSISGLEIKELSFNVKINCEFNPLLKFLEKIKDSAVLITINRIIVSREDKKLPNLASEISLVAYTSIVKKKGSPNRSDY